MNSSVWPCVNTLSAVCVSWRRPPTCLWPDGSPKFGIILRWSNPRSPDRRNHGAPESKHNPASRRYFKYLSGKSSFKIQLSSTYRLFEPTYVVSTRKHVLFCRSWQPDQARKDPCLFFRARHDPDRSHGFCQWLKLSQCSTKETNPASQKSHWSTTLLNMSAFSKNRTVFCRLSWVGLLVFRGSVE